MLPDIYQKQYLSQNAPIMPMLSPNALMYSAVQSQKAVSAHFSGKQILLFAFAEQYCINITEWTALFLISGDNERALTRHNPKPSFDLELSLALAFHDMQ